MALTPQVPADGTTTPNVTISNPDIRRYAGVALYVVSILAALAASFFGVFPEFGGDLVNRILLFSNIVVSFFSGIFGVAITLPNIPKTPTK